MANVSAPLEVGNWPPSWEDPNPYKKSFPIGYYGLPVLWGFGVAALGFMNWRSSSAMRQFSHATNVVNRAERLLLAHRELRERIGPLLASGAKDILVAEDTRVRVWFAVSAPNVVGNVGKGRGFIDAFREPTVWAWDPAAPFTFSKESPWKVNVMRIEMEAAALSAREDARRETALRAGYLKDGAAAASAGGAGGGGSGGGGGAAAPPAAGAAGAGGEELAPEGSYSVQVSNEGSISVLLQVFPLVKLPTEGQLVDAESKLAQLK
jgi:hypothetical protein